MSKRLLAVPLAAALVVGCQKSPHPPRRPSRSRAGPGRRGRPGAGGQPSSPRRSRPAPRSTPWRCPARVRPAWTTSRAPRRCAMTADTAGALVEARRALADDGEDTDALALDRPAGPRLGAGDPGRRGVRAAGSHRPRGRACPWCRPRGCAWPRGTSRPPRPWPAPRWAATRGTSRPGRRSAAPSSARATSPAPSTASSRHGRSSPRTDGCSTTSASPTSGPAATRRRSRCSSAPPSCSPRPRWCRTTSVSPASAPATSTARGTLYARSALLAPKYVKARVNGERTAMVRTGPDGGVDATHVSEEGDGEE